MWETTERLEDEDLVDIFLDHGMNDVQPLLPPYALHALGEDLEVIDEDNEIRFENSEQADSDGNYFRESDEEEEEDDLFFPHPTHNKEIEDEIRAWMGKQLGRDFENINLDNDNEQVSEYEDSEALMSLSDSDGENEDGSKKKRFKEFNGYTDMMGNIKLELGMIFSTYKVFKNALTEYSIQEGKDFIYTHNEKERVSAVCKNKSGWYIHASPTVDKNDFQIKTFRGVHSCGRHVRNTKVDFKWLANKYMDLIRDMPELRLEAFQLLVSRDHNIMVSRSQCYRAKRLTLKMIQGTQLEQYKMLWDYSHAILKWNPESSVHLQVSGSQPVRSQVSGSQPTMKRQSTIRTKLSVRRKQSTMGKTTNDGDVVFSTRSSA